MKLDKTCNILAIDNRIETLTHIKNTFLYHSNIRLDVYDDPVDALYNLNNRLGSRDKYDLAIIDLNMPKMMGDMVSMLFKATDPTIKTVLFTGSKNELFVRCMDCYKFDNICLKREGYDKLKQSVFCNLNLI